MTQDQVNELYKAMSDSTARFQHYSEYIKIMNIPDNDEAFIAWSRTAYLFLSKPAGRS